MDDLTVALFAIGLVLLIAYAARKMRRRRSAQLGHVTRDLNKLGASVEDELRRAARREKDAKRRARRAEAATKKK